MIKNILFLIISVAILQSAKAESPDSLVGYFKNSGKKVSRDSADFYRVILPPDTSINKDYYRVYDYYLNGKVKGISTSLTQPENLILDGMSIEYFPNGKRKRVLQFKQGLPNGTVVNYYPNGKIYSVLNAQKKFIFAIVKQSERYFEYTVDAVLYQDYGYTMNLEEMYDSTGTVWVKKGTGHAVFFDEDFKTVIQQGDVKNSRKEGEWKGLIADSGSYVCEFHNDKLKKGTSTLRSGRHYTFTSFTEPAEYSDGTREFYNYLRKNIHSEIAKKYNMYGTVKVAFFVEEDGTLSNIHIVKSLIKSLDDEALRAVRTCPYWNPSRKYGIPVRTDCVIDVDYNGF